MDAKEEYRPKIFYSSGPMKGLPEPFPMSNNALRKAKSTYATSMYGRKHLPTLLKYFGVLNDTITTVYNTKPKAGFKHVML